MDEQLNRLIKRVLLLWFGTIAFVVFYALDRWRRPPRSSTSAAALGQAVRDNPEDITARGNLADTPSWAGAREAVAVQPDPRDRQGR
jgi:hypothetical protein